MPIVLGTYADLKKHRVQHEKCCLQCHNNFNLKDPILLFRSMFGDDSSQVTHLSCFMKEIKKQFPDYWKDFVLEMI